MAESDADRVRAALDAGCVPQQVQSRNPASRYMPPADTWVNGPFGDSLLLARNGRATALGREWDRQRLERVQPAHQ